MGVHLRTDLKGHGQIGKKGLDGFALLGRPSKGQLQRALFSSQNVLHTMLLATHKKALETYYAAFNVHICRFLNNVGKFHQKSIFSKQKNTNSHNCPHDFGKASCSSWHSAIVVGTTGSRVHTYVCKYIRVGKYGIWGVLLSL